MPYKIIDLQIKGREFANGEVFEDKEAVLLQLIDYHSIDAEEPEMLEKMTVDEILSYGQWELKEIKNYE